MNGQRKNLNEKIISYEFTLDHRFKSHMFVEDFFVLFVHTVESTNIHWISFATWRLEVSMSLIGKVYVSASFQYPLPPILLEGCLGGMNDCLWQRSWIISLFGWNSVEGCICLAVNDLQNLRSCRIVQGNLIFIRERRTLITTVFCFGFQSKFVCTQILRLAIINTRR